jgi:hypothetical protein
LSLNVLIFWIVSAAAAPPISLNKQNPRYFDFRGQPTILFGSTEHYGAVLNTQFDYKKYLTTLSAAKLTLTRTFSGEYRELPSSSIPNNTMNPAPGYYLAPWKRSTQCCYPGYGGGNKFDLDQWDDNYFTRLHSFVQTASDLGIVVNFALYCVFYNNDLLYESPFYWKNNINNIEKIEAYNNFYQPGNPNLVKYETAFVQKLVTELNGYDNLYYEIINEPYIISVSADWQVMISNLIAETESKLPNTHLIGRGIANVDQKVVNCCSNVSIYNFHYAIPEAVYENYDLDKPIAYDETGFSGKLDEPYRRFGWLFILAGGAVYDNLDYSFYVGYEDGTGVPAPVGGGSVALREQILILKEFVFGLDFINMKGDNSLVANIMPRNNFLQYSAFVHIQEEMFAVYFGNSTDGNPITLNLNLNTKSVYEITWLNPVTGIRTNGGSWSSGPIVSPSFKPDIAMLLKKSTIN